MNAAQREQGSVRYGRIRSRFAIALAAFVFFAMGLVFVPRLGFEYDEVMFAPIVFHPAKSFFAARISHHLVPLMQMSYIGALKVWLYSVVFKWWHPGLYSVRVPVLVLASLTILPVAGTVRNRGSSRAAVFTAALLATDITFLLCSTFDWGPVVIQNFLLAVAVYLILVRRRTAFGLPLAAFALGLALWDKAIFVWIFVGLCVSGLTFGFGVLWREANIKRLAVALLAFLVGVTPLLVYNVKRRNQTLSANAHFTFTEIRAKFTFVKIAVNGQSFPNFFVDASAPRYAAPTAKASPESQFPVRHQRNPSNWRFSSFLCLLLSGLACARKENRRLILWISCAVILAWSQSAITKDAGGFVHHVVIFYPALFAGLGLAAEEIARALRQYGTLFLSLAGVLLCGAGLNTIYAHFLDIGEFSPSQFWTDADRPLAGYIASHRDRHVLIADWGIATQAETRLPESLSIEEVSFRLKDGNLTSDEAREWARSQSLIVVHTANHEMFPNQRGKLARLAQSSGLIVVPVETVNDRAGHPMFEIDKLSFVPGA